MSRARYTPDVHHRRQLLLTLGASIGLCGLTTSTVANGQVQPDEIDRYPVALDKNCRNGNARIFDECGSQLVIFQEALIFANKIRKTLLVSFGAEWCIWCHVFDAYVNGKYSTFEYDFDGQRALLKEYGGDLAARDAQILHRYVSDAFVLVHIEGKYSPDGEEVLRRAGALAHFSGSLPFIFSVTPRGRWAATFDYRSAETRREGQDWFRGYNRESLLAELKGMKAAAST